MYLSGLFTLLSQRLLFSVYLLHLVAHIVGYEFTKAPEPINMEEIVETLAHHPIISMWTKEMPK